MARYGYNWLMPLTPRQLRRQVNNQLNPRIASGDRAINAYTNALAAHLMPAQANSHQIYSQAQAQQSAIDSALANRLSGAGSQVSGDLASQLSQAGQNTAPAQEIAQEGQGAGNASYASGTATLSQLLSQGAAAQQFAGMLPNIARLSGQQQQGQNRAQIMSQFPQLYQQAMDREFNKAVAVQSGLVDQAKMGQQQQQFNARQRQSQQQFNARQRQDQQHFDTQTSLAMGRINLSKDQYNLAVKREQRMARTRSGKSGGFTPSQLSKFHATAVDTVKDWKHGVPNPYYNPSSSNYHNGVADSQQNLHPARPNDPRGAFKYLVLHGVPPSIADDAVGRVFGKWKSKKYKGKH